MEITEANFQLYRNQGGYDFLGRSVDKLRTTEQLAKTKEVCNNLSLDGLVLIGASHTITDASIVSEHFLREGVPTRIVAVPCTLDGNVHHDMFEQSVGFDSASKLYGQLIGNLMTDAASAIKYWYFIRLMGRDPSHLAVECALNTQPNYVVVSEEMVSENLTLNDLVNQLADVVSDRAA